MTISSASVACWPCVSFVFLNIAEDRFSGGGPPHSNGNILADGDTVTAIEDPKVEGASSSKQSCPPQRQTSFTHKPR
ncbi:PhnA domain-containing protein [Sedimentitalea nanhaiensis]|uniref:PhnA domain-containing protein n=1 Tax=Sedimentitalea nanhaiensis TaxID=999627 RepID=UPI00349E9EDD